MNKLEGKTALITGGTRGIGLATAKAFVNEGAYTFITGRREAELAAAVKEIGRNVTGIQGDVSNLGDLGRLFCTNQARKWSTRHFVRQCPGRKVCCPPPDHRGALRLDLP